jgi:hypothetical protein
MYLRTNGLGDVAKGVDSGSANSLLVCLEQLEQLEANAHPLTRGNMLSTSICGSKEACVRYE